MSKIDLMKKFMNTFVGNDFRLVIKDDGNCFTVHTIEIIQKTGNSCPVKEVRVGDYFLRLLVRDENDREASILCNWSEELLQNLLDHYIHAKEAGCKEIVMVRDPSLNDPNNWLLLWGVELESPVRLETLQKPHPLAYIY